MQNRQFDRPPSAPRSCAETQEQFFLQMEGLLSLIQEATLQAHLDSCDACQREWSQYRLLESQLRSAHEAIPAPGDLSVGFYQKLAQERIRTAPRFRWFIALPTFATAMLALVFWQAASRQTNQTLVTPIEIGKGAISTSNNRFSPLKPSEDVAHVPTPSLDRALDAPTLVRVHGVSLRRKHTGFAKRNNAPPVARQPVVLALATSQEPPLEGVDLVVTDDERGFESKVHIGGEETERHGVRTVTIDDDTPATMPTFAVEKSQE